MKRISLLFLSLLFLAVSITASGQQTYYPNGNPDKWNFQIVPFMWMPAMSGEMTSSYLSQDFNMSTIDLISNLKMAFFFNAEASNGKVFIMPTYTYAKIGTDKVLFTAPNDQEVSVAPTLAMNIGGLILGLHETVNEKLIIDPYLGVRYNNFKTTLELTGLMENKKVDETAEFTDPFFGLRIIYFPHPRVPIMFRSDVGGFGIGSDYSWTAMLDAGYSLSPTVDLIGGFSAYGMKFTGEVKTGSTAEMSMVMYGLNVGIRIMLPKRNEDPEVFKKFAK